MACFVMRGLLFSDELAFTVLPFRSNATDSSG